ncbi:MAG: pirin family protein [Eubacteriales bacterium]
MNRKISKIIRGTHAVDGAGVQLVRVLGNRDVWDFDPFLMLDSFDSTDPEDYVKGFPTHPHRGIETITYLISGKIEHEDSLGNKGTIQSGQSQWMSAGSGILHQEMPRPSERMLGLQLWLNLPSGEKMTPPSYFDITSDMMPRVETEGAIVKVISGEYNGVRGVRPPHIQATLYDITVKPGQSVSINTRDETAFIFTILGDAVCDGQRIAEKSAVLFGEGNGIEVSAPADGEARFIFFMAPALHEPIAWGGPIVMNTKEQLDTAFRQLRDGTFLKQ